MSFDSLADLLDFVDSHYDRAWGEPLSFADVVFEDDTN
jgi:hypothetical protein